MDERAAFDAIKNAIVRQNEAFLRDLARRFGRRPEDFLERYLRPEYYLPIVDRRRGHLQ